MPEQTTLLREDRLALSVLLSAGADPGRLARWYANNSEHSHSHITTTINDLTGTGVLGRVTAPGRGQHGVQCAGGTQTVAADNVQMGS